ncbi:MAG: GGDEF domain-containing protein [Actinomycetota bacterium]
MGVESSHLLLAEARGSGFSENPDLIVRVEHAIDDAAKRGDDHELGRLLMVSCIARQGCGDASAAALAAAQAVTHFANAGASTEAASASATAAVYTDQCGDLAGALDHAVDAFVHLGDSQPTDEASVRTLLALGGLLMRLASFDAAVITARRAFDAAATLEHVPIDAVAYSFGYIAVEAAHAATDDEAKRRVLADVDEAASWLTSNGASPVARELLGPGLAAEATLARGDVPDRGELATAGRRHHDAVPDLVAWHRLVCGLAALANDEPAAALVDFDASIPGLQASADHHCLARAIEGRADAHAALGDFAAAHAEAKRLAAWTRRLHLDQMGQLAGQVVRHAELLRAQTELRDEAQRLADDIDLDAATGTRSRRWLERRLDDLATSDADGAVLIFDLDLFKVVNDTYGHHVGDDVLTRFGVLANQLIGPDADLARFGGEEFVLVRTEPTGGCRAADLDAAELAERVRLTVATHDWGSIAPGLDVTVSCGVATGPLRDVRRLMIGADEALLDAKRRGRNRVTAHPAVPPLPNTRVDATPRA